MYKKILWEKTGAVTFLHVIFIIMGYNAFIYSPLLQQQHIK